MQPILIIEDEEMMRKGLADLLSGSGYEVAEITNAELRQAHEHLADLVQTIVELKPKLILLDINLPGINGELLLKSLRQTSTIPVIMLTSSSTEMDEVLSMSYGADDYITKPYNPQILLLRIAAILKRAEGNTGPVMYHDVRIDLNRGIMETHSKKVWLTKNEMIILGHLLSRQGQIVTRDALMTDLWNNHEYINDNALTVNVSRVRAKLQKLGLGEAITTRKGLGYILA